MYACETAVIADPPDQSKEETIMTLVRWSDPFREFAQLQDRINRVFSDTYGRGGTTKA